MRFACPLCGATYQVKDRSRLEKAGGQVRCYRCHQVFLISEVAGEHIAEPPRAAEPEKSTVEKPESRAEAASPVTKLGGTAAKVEPTANEPEIPASDATKTPAAVEIQTPATAEVETSAAVDEAAPKPAEETTPRRARSPHPALSRSLGETATDQAAPSSPAAVWAWGLVAMMLLVLIVAQVLWQLRESPPVHAFLSNVCEMLGCTLPAQRHPEAFTVIERVFLRDPEHPGVLSLRLRFTNGSEFEQPYPGIELVLFDSSQAVVGKSRVPPKQYLGKADITDLAAGESAEIKLFVADPGEVATGFAIEFF